MLRHDGRSIRAVVKGESVDTGRRKLGAVMGDGVHTGINTSINVGVMMAACRSTRPGEVVSRSVDAYMQKLAGRVQKVC